MWMYLRLLKIFYHNALITDLEYRLNFWVNVSLSFFWMLSAALSIRIFFLYADQIVGWTYYELLLVLGLFFFMNGYRKMVLDPNLARIVEYIRLGTLDYILTKPVNSQFLVSLRYLDIYKWSDLIIGLGLVGYALWNLHQVPSVLQILLFVVLLIAAMVLLYSLSLISQTTTFWLINATQMGLLVQGFLETGRFPITFYQGWMRQVLTFVIPVAFITSFPAQVLLGRIDGWLVVAEVGAAALFFALASIFWRFALRSYTSASS